MDACEWVDWRIRVWGPKNSKMSKAAKYETATSNWCTAPIMSGANPYECAEVEFKKWYRCESYKREYAGKWCGNLGFTGLYMWDEAPGFTLRNSDNEEVSLKDFKGNIVLLNFYASSCFSGCQSQMTQVQRLYETFKEQGLVVLAITKVEGSKGLSKSFDPSAFTFPILLDNDGKVAREYPSPVRPHSILIDRQGNMYWQRSLSQSGDKMELEATIRELIERQ